MSISPVKPDSQSGRLGGCINKSAIILEEAAMTILDGIKTGSSVEFLAEIHNCSTLYLWGAPTGVIPP